MPLRVLVVDDYVEHSKTLADTLAMYGCEAKTTDNMRSGLILCETFQPHLVICDGLLGEASKKEHSWKVFYEICNMVEDKTLDKRPYMVALTGFSSTLHRKLNEECGADVYIAKPIELSTLLTWVQKAKELAGEYMDSN